MSILATDPNLGQTHASFVDALPTYGAKQVDHEALPAEGTDPAALTYPPNRWNGVKLLNALRDLSATSSDLAVDLDYGSLCTLIKHGIVTVEVPGDEFDVISEFGREYWARIVSTVQPDTAVASQIDFQEADSWLESSLCNALAKKPLTKISLTRFGNQLDEVLTAVEQNDDEASAFVITEILRCIRKDTYRYPNDPLNAKIARSMTDGYRECGTKFFSLVAMAIGVRELRQSESMLALLEDIRDVSNKLGPSTTQIDFKALSDRRSLDFDFLLIDFVKRLLPCAVLTAGALALEIVFLNKAGMLSPLVFLGLVGLAGHATSKNWFGRPLYTLGTDFPTLEMDVS